jgi:hypothetical protein
MQNLRREGLKGEDLHAKKDQEMKIYTRRRSQRQRSACQEGPKDEDLHKEKVLEARSMHRVKLTIHVIEATDEAEAQI